MSSHADKNLHRKIYNINDTDTFPPYHFFKNVIFAHEFMHKFMCESASEFMKEFFTNFVHESEYEIRTNCLHEKLVMLRMACIINKTFIIKAAYSQHLSCSKCSVFRIRVTLCFSPVNISYLNKCMLNKYVPPFSLMFFI